jgi:hypothetical protein
VTVYQGRPASWAALPLGKHSRKRKQSKVAKTQRLSPLRLGVSLRLCVNFLLDYLLLCRRNNPTAHTSLAEIAATAQSSLNLRIGARARDDTPFTSVPIFNQTLTRKFSVSRLLSTCFQNRIHREFPRLAIRMPPSQNFPYNPWLPNQSYEVH